MHAVYRTDSCHTAEWLRTTKIKYSQILVLIVFESMGVGNRGLTSCVPDTTLSLRITRWTDQIQIFRQSSSTKRLFIQPIRLTIGRAGLTTDSGWFGTSLAPGAVLPENQSNESVRIPGLPLVSFSVGVRACVVKVDGAVACARASTRR